MISMNGLFTKADYKTMSLSSQFTLFDICSQTFDLGRYLYRFRASTLLMSVYERHYPAQQKMLTCRFGASLK